MHLDVASCGYLKYGVLAGLGAVALGGGIYWLIKKIRKVQGNPSNLNTKMLVRCQGLQKL